jgi:hypothetical protein
MYKIFCLHPPTINVIIYPYSHLCHIFEKQALIHRAPNKLKCEFISLEGKTSTWVKQHPHWYHGENLLFFNVASNHYKYSTPTLNQGL